MTDALTPGRRSAIGAAVVAFHGDVGLDTDVEAPWCLSHGLAGQSAAAEFDRLVSEVPR
jgi:hypothetical protein